jgi:hypothetical protein
MIVLLVGAGTDPVAEPSRWRECINEDRSEERGEERSWRLLRGRPDRGSVRWSRFDCFECCVDFDILLE